METCMCCFADDTGGHQQSLPTHFRRIEHCLTHRSLPLKSDVFFYLWQLSNDCLVLSVSSLWSISFSKAIIFFGSLHLRAESIQNHLGMSSLLLTSVLIYFVLSRVILNATFILEGLPYCLLVMVKKLIDHQVRTYDGSCTTILSTKFVRTHLNKLLSILRIQLPLFSYPLTQI